MRLIDADKFIEYLSAQRDVCIDYDDLLNAKVYQIAIDEIKRADTIEAEPVVHAHWEKFDNNGRELAVPYCSHCLHLPLRNNAYTIVLSNICPYCGAIMDKEVKKI